MQALPSISDAWPTCKYQCLKYGTMQMSDQTSWMRLSREEFLEEMGQYKRCLIVRHGLHVSHEAAIEGARNYDKLIGQEICLVLLSWPSQPLLTRISYTTAEGVASGVAGNFHQMVTLILTTGNRVNPCTNRVSVV